MPGFHISGEESWENDQFSPRAHGAGTSVADLARTYRWYLESLDWPGNNIDPQLGNVHSHEALKTFLSMDLPSVRVKEQQVLGFSIPYKFAKSVDFGDIDITFYDLYDRGETTQDIIEQWLHVVWNPYDGLGNGYARAYKGKLQAVEIDNDGSEKARFVLWNAWPKGIKPTQMAMDKNDIKKISVTFAYDWYTYDSLNYMAMRDVPDYERTSRLS